MAKKAITKVFYVRWNRKKVGEDGFYLPFGALVEAPNQELAKHKFKEIYGKDHNFAAAATVVELRKNGSEVHYDEIYRGRNLT